MVLRIKEREEAIQLLAMDPQVCGKLLTLHWKGNRVDVEALCDLTPFDRMPEKAPRWDLKGTEGCGGGKVFLWMLLVVWGYMGISRRKNQVRRCTRGPQGWGRALRPRGRLVAPPTSSPSLLDHVCSKNNAPEGFIPFGLRLIFLFGETLKQEKNSNLGQAPG